MFLHDELYNMCRNRKITNPEDINKLHQDVIERCLSNIQLKIHVGMPNKKAKAIMDRTFNFYKCFIRKMIKSDDQVLVKLGKLFDKYNFKDEFLSNKSLNDVYTKL